MFSMGGRKENTERELNTIMRLISLCPPPIYFFKMQTLPMWLFVVLGGKNPAFHIYFKWSHVLFKQGDSVDASCQREDPVRRLSVRPLHLSIPLLQGWVTCKHTCMGFPILVTQGGVSNLKLTSLRVSMSACAYVVGDQGKPARKRAEALCSNAPRGDVLNDLKTAAKPTS